MCCGMLVLLLRARRAGEVADPSRNAARTKYIKSSVFFLVCALRMHMVPEVNYRQMEMASFLLRGVLEGGLSEDLQCLSSALCGTKEIQPMIYTISTGLSVM